MNTIFRCAPGIIFVFLVLGGCVPAGYVINSPPASSKSSVPCTDPSGMACNVTLNVSWTGASAHLYPDSTTLDGTVITPAWSQATNSVQATITAATGTHTVEVFGILSGSNGTATQSMAQTFILTGNTPPATTPTITSSSAATSERGDTVTLTGTNFDANCAHDTVTVGGQTVAPVAGSCSATSLKVKIPFTAAAGPTGFVVTANGTSSAALATGILMTEVIVSGSPISNSFVVIDATKSSLSFVNPPSGIGGTVVSCKGNTAAIGSATSGTGQVELVDLTDPKNPVIGPPLATNFTQLGSIAFDGTHVVAGDSQGSQVFILTRNVMSLSKTSSSMADFIGVTSAALSGTSAFVTGATSQTFDVINPLTSTTPVSHNPNNGLGLSLDVSGTLAALGSTGGGTVKTVTAATGAASGSKSTPLGSVDSVSMSGSMVAAGSVHSTGVFLINFATPSSPQISAPINLNGSGGYSVVLNGTPMQLIAGNTNGFDIHVLPVTTNGMGVPAVGTDNPIQQAGVAGASTLCVTTF